MEVLSHDVEELILERVRAESLVRFKSVSKQWKSTIESNNFQKRQMIRSQQSRDPDVFFLHYGDDYHSKNIPSSSSSVTIVNIRVYYKKGIIYSTTSCDGLVCLYNVFNCEVNNPSIVFNPTTRWHRALPPSNLRKQRSSNPYKLGFGKDKVNGTYKPVWLYNNYLLGVTTTTCEVFDFSINAWRYITSAPPDVISLIINPAYVDGSLYWFTEGTNVLSLDLHKETFQVIPKVPVVHHVYDPNIIILCNMNNRLCLSETNYKRSNQVIWSFDSGNKTWNHMYSIDLNMTPFLTKLFSTVAVLEEKNKLLLCDLLSGGDLVIYDGQTKSYDLAFKSDSLGYAVCYFQSLISIL